MPRSTFFYILKSIKKEDKDRRLKEQIKDLYEKKTYVICKLSRYIFTF